MAISNAPRGTSRLRSIVTGRSSGLPRRRRACCHSVVRINTSGKPRGYADGPVEPGAVSTLAITAAPAVARSVRRLRQLGSSRQRRTALCPRGCHAPAKRRRPRIPAPGFDPVGQVYCGSFPRSNTVDGCPIRPLLTFPVSIPAHSARFSPESPLTRSTIRSHSRAKSTTRRALSNRGTRSPQLPRYPFRTGRIRSMS